MDARDEELVEAISGLLKDPRSGPGPVIEDERQAARAVRLIDERLKEEAGVYRLALEQAQAGAETLSSDRLQVLSEMVQNADDARATEIRLTWGSDELLVAHDGHGMRLADVLLLGLPWLSGKSLDAESTGRFGIGLTTLRALSTAWEAHCHPFHVRFAGLSMQPVPAPLLPANAAGPRWTVFRIPLAPGTLTLDELTEWFESWHDSSLVFLGSLRRVTLLERDGSGPAGAAASVVRTLGLTWHDLGTRPAEIGGGHTEVRMRRARTSDGSEWLVYDTRVPTPPGAKRLHKATAETVPLAVALPLSPTVTAGSVHAGLPVAPLEVAARVHAQFDPVASREGFASRPWNNRLAPLVADLWALGVLDVLESCAPDAWHLIPLAPAEPPAGSAAKLPDRIRDALTARARTWVAARLAPPGPDGSRTPLASLAVEDRRLTGVVTDEHLAELAGLTATFPHSARDAAGRWRQVLTDWRAAGGAALADEVQIADALVLLKRPDYPVGRTLRLTAVAIEAELDSQLLSTACVLASDGRRLLPPVTGRAFADRADEAGAATGHGGARLAALGIVQELDAAYWEETEHARAVVSWLRTEGCLVNQEDTLAVLGRVAQLGRAGLRMGSDGVTDGVQLTALQRAFGDISDKQRKKLGRDVGKAVLLSAFRYGRDGQEEPCTAAPGDCALPLALDTADRGRFAVAARRTPGITWADRAYARSLLATSPNNPLSRTAFLRLLGVADAPRLEAPPRSLTEGKYTTDRRRGLPRVGFLSTPDRRLELDRLKAHYTLDDLCSPQLDAVLADLVAERDVQERRKRTVALLHTLGKQGLLVSRENREKQAVFGHHGWKHQGLTKAQWVWRLLDVPWLEDATGTLRRPGELHLRTADTLALYGPDDPGYLHPEIQRDVQGRAEVLHTLGISENPDVPALIGRLRQLRARLAAPGPVPDDLAADVHLVYGALARRLDATSAETPRATAERRIRAAFQGREDLVLTDQGWQRPGSVFRGATILRGHRPFVLPEPALLPLWNVLGILEPREEDLAEVLKEIALDGARPVGERQRVMLEALRQLAKMIGEAERPVPIGLRARLRSLPLWTSSGWTKQRPVHAVDHPVLAAAVAQRLPVWQPGGDLQQFGPLLGLLKIDRVEAAGAQVLGAAQARPDTGLTEGFRRAVAALQDTLVRDEPRAARAFTGWSWLAQVDVRVLAGLRVRVVLDEGRETVELDVGAQLDPAAGVLYVAAPEELGTTRGGGQAVASVFSGERTHVGHRWRDIWESGELDGAPESPLVSAEQRDHEERERHQALLRERREAAALSSLPGPTGSRRSPGAAARPTVPVPATAPTPQPTPVGGSLPRPRPPAPRRLVDAAVLLTNAPAVTRPTAAAPAAPLGTARPRPSRRTSSLPQPRPGGSAPQSPLGVAGPRDQEKETLALRMLTQALEAEGLTVEDHRAHAGLGADAMASNGHFYELKAHGGPEPTEISLTGAELRRALAERERFSLVIASYLEQGLGRPTLRIIADPLTCLTLAPTEEVKLKGLRGAQVEAVVCEWGER
ncbi:ATP-binding protein [Streptomyces sp. P9-2B-2]|uniref:ATP-binding protein n=1 Tax=Streptomyces TaxID=1883 RepID=UPI002253BD39|nr:MULTISPECIES: ATP-binding protein [Streptomyces]MCX4639255.1 ATP-binding protein [Streptomyces platensis]WJY39254.1 ATP-binding protein [Streptomyces sp. P9-2B-2]